MARGTEEGARKAGFNIVVNEGYSATAPDKPQRGRKLRQDFACTRHFCRPPVPTVALLNVVQSACDYVKAAAAWLSGQTPPKHEDNERTIDELRDRIRKTVAFAESVKESQYADARERKVKLSWAPGKVIGGEDYLLQMTIPNTFFHIAMAYAILRHNGVDVGKMDFLGSINLVDA